MSDLGAEYTPDEARLNRIFDRLTSNVRGIIVTAADSAANAAADQLDKAKAEIDGVLAELRDQSVRPETLQRLEALAQSFDDEVPDAQPTPEPTPEPAPEPAPAEPPA